MPDPQSSLAEQASGSPLYFVPASGTAVSRRRRNTPNQIARRGRYRSAWRRLACVLGGADRNDDLVPFSLHCVGMGLIEIKHYARDERTRAVLPSSHAAHSIRIDGNVFGVVAGRWCREGRAEYGRDSKPFRPKVAPER